MTESVGTISYTIDADTSELLDAEKMTTKSTNKMVGDLEKVDKQSKKLSTTITKTAKGVKSGMVGMGRGAGQAGIQLQQFIGQVQGGQSAMLALSQQSADLGIVLGAPLLGAVVGISASIAGMLLPNLFKAKEETEDLTEALRGLATQSQLTADEARILSEAEGRKVAESLEKQQKLTKQLTEAKALAGRQQGVLNQFTDKGTEKYKRYAKGLSETQAEISKLEVSLVVIGKKIEEGSQNIVTYNNNIGKGTQSTTEFEKKTSAFTLSLESQIIALRDGEEASLRFATAQQLGLKVGEQIPANIDEQINALFRLKKAKEDAGESKREKGKASTFARQVAKRGVSKEDKLAADLRQIERDKDLVSLEEYEAAKTAIEKQQTAEREANRAKEVKSQEAAQTAMAGAVLGFVSATTSALMSGMDEQSGAYKALFAIQKASQIAMTIANAETAATAAMASMPGPAGIALGGIVRGLGYASAGVIAGQSIAGARERGGPVSAGGMYRMGEGNKPEVLQTGQGMFAVPGDNGKVFNQSQLGQIGGNQAVQVSVNVENNMGGQASVSTQASDDGRIVKIVINEVASQISRNQGTISRALKQSTNVTMKANK